MFGFELLFTTIQSQLKSKNDLLVSVLHLHCIKRDFLCVGIGENFTESDEYGSELLPNGWNDSNETYILRYINTKTKQKLLVKCVKVSDLLIISALLISGENSGSTHSLRPDDYISDDFMTFERAFSAGSVGIVSQTLEKEIINKVLIPSTQTQTETQTQTTNTRHNPLREGPPNAPNPVPGPDYGGMGYEPFYGQPQWPPPIGGADLDPFGRGQGGMLMDPRQFPEAFGRPRNPAPGMPRGAVPPGARFDPFHPIPFGPNPRPNRNPRPFGPDPDNMRPPGYDDMFM